MLFNTLHKGTVHGIVNRIHVFLFNVLLVALCHVKFILFFVYFFGQWYLAISNNVSIKNVCVIHSIPKEYV